MTLLSAEKISKKFNDQIILSGVSFSVVSGDQIGLVGKNGSGKTTLFEIMAGRIETDSGDVKRARNCLIDYVEQEVTQFLELSLFDYVTSARQDLVSARHQISELEERLSIHPNDTESLSLLGQLQTHFEENGGFTFEAEIKIILLGLGFPRERHSDRLRNFSGGEKNRASLARALAGRGNLLLLDEPTNHLDIDSTVWLEEYLKAIDRAYMVVSHDRTFLNATVTKVWEMTSGHLDTYTGSFEKYLVERAERKRLHQHRYEHQQAEIKRLEEFVRRNMAGQKTKQAQSKLKYLGRIKRLPPPRTDGKGPTIKVRSSGRSYAHVMSLKDLALGYGGEAVVSGVSIDLYRGDRVGLIGRNGAGKSTILKALIGELIPTEGELKLGANVDVAYFDQELADLKPNATVLDCLWEVDAMVEMGVIRSFLGRFGFTGDDCLKKVFSLSGGEKTKLSLARLLYHPANFIIFDEPTNHLDMQAREALEEALLDYGGSCLIVSHDRFFLDRVVNRVIHVANRTTTTYEGNYSYYLEQSTAGTAPQPEKDSSGKSAYLEFKEQSRRRSRHKKAIEQTRQLITELEATLTRLDEEIELNISPDDWEKLNNSLEQKSEAEEKILNLYAQLEKLEATEID